MNKSIITKEFVKDIKIHDSAVNVGVGIKDIGVKTKETGFSSFLWYIKIT